MTGPTRLILIRHAEPSEADRERWCGRTDVELGDAGHERARQVAAALAHEPVAAVYTSPLVRARDTAAPIGAALGLEPVAVDDLREIDFGDIDGLRFDEWSLRFPELVGWSDTPSTAAFPGGERIADVRCRVLAAVSGLRQRHAGETAILVAHGGPIRVVLADVLRLHPDAMFRLLVDHGSVSVVEWYDETPYIRFVNGPAAALASPGTPPRAT
jgi:broad specificity phosphatase PhoE